MHHAHLADACPLNMHQRQRPQIDVNRRLSTANDAMMRPAVALSKRMLLLPRYNALAQMRS